MSARFLAFLTIKYYQMYNLLKLDQLFGLLIGCGTVHQVYRRKIYLREEGEGQPYVNFCRDYQHGGLFARKEN